MLPPMVIESGFEFEGGGGLGEEAWRLLPQTKRHTNRGLFLKQAVIHADAGLFQSDGGFPWKIFFREMEAPGNLNKSGSSARGISKPEPCPGSGKQGGPEPTDGGLLGARSGKAGYRVDEDRQLTEHGGEVPSVTRRSGWLFIALFGQESVSPAHRFPVGVMLPCACID